MADCQLPRPGSSRACHIAEVSLSQKVNRLPRDMQDSFRRTMTEIYEQEHNSMMNIIDEARQSFALTLDELRDEQQVLSLTADKISKTRLSSATRRRNTTPRPETSRSGIIAARHQRVLSAKKARRQSEHDMTTHGESSRPMTATVRPATAYYSTRPSTAAAARPGSSSYGRRSPTSAGVSSSMDSISFESERRRRMHGPAFTERQQPRVSSPDSSPATSPTTFTIISPRTLDFTSLSTIIHSYSSRTFDSTTPKTLTNTIQGLW